MSRPSIAAIPALAFLIAALSGVPDACAANDRHLIPLTPQLLVAMKQKEMRKEDPILIRSYKQEGELEIWKKNRNGHYALLKVFPICRWSGQLGPKQKEGDGQAPEGFYAITPAQMNPNSNYHLAFNTGYPNAYDRAHGGTGSYLMVHGDCQSIGCYAMSDQQIEEIYALVREAHAAGQQAVQMQAFPFRFTPQNMAVHRLDPNMPFWENLKEGADRFDIAKEEPRISLCDGRYAFDRVGSSDQNCGREANPDLVRKVAEKTKADNMKVAALVAKGEPAVAFAYVDGGQNAYFRNKIRPELLVATGPIIRLMDASGVPTAFAVSAAGGDESSIVAAVRNVKFLSVVMTEAASSPRDNSKPASPSPSTAGRQAAVTAPAPTPPTPGSEVAHLSGKSDNGVAAPPVAPSPPARQTLYERYGSFTTIATALAIGLILALAATVMRILRRKRTVRDLKEEA